MPSESVTGLNAVSSGGHVNTVGNIAVVVVVVMVEVVVTESTVEYIPVSVLQKPIIEQFLLAHLNQ